jgi:hypothetical protein
MADDEAQRTSAPDLDILGDQVILHPSGFIEPPQEGGKEQALMQHGGRFRESPLE